MNKGNYSCNKAVKDDFDTKTKYDCPNVLSATFGSIAVYAKDGDGYAVRTA